MKGPDKGSLLPLTDAAIAAAIAAAITIRKVTMSEA
jgi:hypothetical protein